MPVDVHADVGPLLEREVDGVATLLLFQGISRKARILSRDMDMDRLATSAGVDVEMAVAGAEKKCRLSTDWVALVPRGVALRHRSHR